MKTLFFIFSFFFAFTLSAQGNLQFNQVLSPSISTSSTLFANTSQQLTVTIPTGKVWKIESASFVLLSGNEIYSLTMGGQQTTTNPYFFMDDHILGTYVNNFGLVDPTFPIWLQSGTHILRICNNSGNNWPNNLRGTIRVIEFNIVP